MVNLDEVQLREIFDELKSQDSARDFITFKDFKRAIINFKLQIMRGLSPSNPDFHDYCKELFMLIC